MAECNPQELLLEASCFTCLPADQQYLVRLSLLCRILNGVTLPCDVNTLLEEAKCFACLPPGMWPILELQLLCQIAQNGGGGGGVDCSPVAARIEHQLGSQNIPTSVDTEVEYDTVVFDTDSIADIANNQLVIPEDGIWEITSIVTWGDDSGNTIPVRMTVLRNGVGVGQDFSGFDTTVTSTYTQELVQILQLNAGDEITVNVLQSSLSGALVGDEPGRVVLSASKVVGCAATA